ncbi:cytochrome c [Palleronia sp.]|uniref:cytochrome c n=1 Tax=Palleronia sp. TaxID=1940284 RepID=UPI0035C7CF0C
MRVTWFRVLLGFLLLLVGALIAALIWAHEPAIAEVDRPDPEAFDASAVEEGARLAAVGNCIACHTVPGGEAFAGGLAVPTPFGTIYSTNITPDPETGIGNWGLAAFERSMREGIDREGNHLYPAFPYTHYTLTSDEDIAAIYAYLMTRQPVEYAAPEPDLPFPLNMRPILAGWKLLYFDKGAFVPDPDASDLMNRGAYLAEGLGHCGGCHTPRNWAGAQIDEAHWSGGSAEGWTAYPIDETSPAPIPWRAEDLAFYLRHGWHAAHGVSRGPMAEVTGNLGRLPDEDIVAIATYTAAQMGTPSQDEIEVADQLLEAVQTGRGRGQAADTMATPPAPENERGAAIFATACASCHEAGRPQPYGGLDFRLSTAVHAGSPQNIVNVTLFGLPPADGAASAIMPAYRSVLSDADMVALLDYMRAAYTDLPAWEGLEEMISATRSGEHHVSIRPADMIERGPGNLGAEEQPWRQD